MLPWHVSERREIADNIFNCRGVEETPLFLLGASYIIKSVRVQGMRVNGSELGQDLFFRVILKKCK